VALRQDALLQRIAALESALEQAQRLALTDELTGCANRRAWTLALAREQARCTRYVLDAVVAVVDLDRFKSVNDEEGHHAGDDLLRRCAAALSSTVRGCDVVARLGGDEFAVLAVQTSEAATAWLDDRLAHALSDAGVEATTACAALSQSDSLEDAWRRADRAMLARKAG
jgi:diguanylate cyclase (GGDEF)-like protein